MQQDEIVLKKIAEVSLDKDLSVLANWLGQKKVCFKIVEQGGLQAVYADERVALNVQELVSQMLADESVVSEMKRSLPASTGNLFAWHMVRRPVSAPLVVALILVSVAVAVFTALGDGGPLLRALVFADPFQVADDSFSDRLSAILFNATELQWWRFFSPAVVHFSILHLVFNMLWLWYLGAMVEMKQGRIFFLMLFLCTAFISNMAQYIHTGPLFGGMSGVVYGLVGYCWLWDKVNKPLFLLPDALMGFMMVWLMIGFFDLTSTVPGLGKMANTAHAVGLITGVILAYIAPVKKDFSR